MEIWNMWTTLIADSITFLSVYFGVSEALAIIAFTLIVRILLMPVSLKSAYGMYKNRRAIERVKPDVERLKDFYKGNPTELTKRIMALYKQHGIKFLDGTTVINIGSQGLLGLGMFQALRDMLLSSNFLWITNIAKPDFILALLVGVLTFISMLMMPGAVEQQSFLIFLIPAVISVFVLISFPSAIGFYWAVSNIVTMFQAAVLHVIILRKTLTTRRV